VNDAFERLHERKTAKDSISAMLPGWSGGKETVPRTSLKYPKTAKSYHSNTFPAIPAIVLNVSR
jgi:hypothetical protein